MSNYALRGMKINATGNPDELSEVTNVIDANAERITDDGCEYLCLKINDSENSTEYILVYGKKITDTDEEAKTALCTSLTLIGNEIKAFAPIDVEIQIDKDCIFSDYDLDADKAGTLYFGW